MGFEHLLMTAFQSIYYFFQLRQQADDRPSNSKSPLVNSSVAMLLERPQISCTFALGKKQQYQKWNSMIMKRRFPKGTNP